MWAKQLLLGLIGAAAGSAAAAGTFAFIIMLGVIPRMVGKSKTATRVLCYENAIMAGGILGNVVSVFQGLTVPFGQPFLILYGLCGGIFVGCNAIALAEVLKTFPILFRRAKLKTGLSTIVLILAIGKTLGSFWYFFHQMSGS